MEQELPKHEKIRFRKRDRSRLDSLPSAGGPALRHPFLIGRFLRRAALFALGGALGLVGLLAFALYIVSVTGIGGERLRAAAEAEIGRTLGTPVTARIGSMGLSLDGTSLIALKLEDVGVADRATGKPMLNAGAMRFGLRLVPLLSGKLELGSATLATAVLDMSALPHSTEASPLARYTDSDGVVRPSLIAAAVFESVDAIGRTIEASGVSAMDVAGVTLRLGEGEDQKSILVTKGRLWRAAHGAVKLESEVVVDGRRIGVSAELPPAANGEPGKGFKVGLEWRSREEPFPGGGGRTPLLQVGTLAITLTGTSQDSRRRLAADIQFQNASLDLKQDGVVTGSGVITALMNEGVDRVDFPRLAVDIGRTGFMFVGSIWSESASEAGQAPRGYRYQLVSPAARLAASDSSEPPVLAQINIAGHVDSDWRRVVAESLNVTTNAGRVAGTASLRFEDGKSVGLDLAVGLDRMPVSQVKQIWPFFAAPGTREWVIGNVFGGVVENTRLVVRSEPAEPGAASANTEESTGHFEVRGTRFDVAGNIPPMRDADGIIDFAGSRVDIALQSGTIYMPSGRTVAASNGTLVIADTAMHPLIADMAVDVEGDAPAIIELAGYDPINAARFIDIKPEDVEGEVKGRVTGDIPFQKDIPADDLDWHVDLAYENLSVAKPFNGQMMTEANGTITVDPHAAVIAATGKLNGVPATISMTEPIGDHDAKSMSSVTLELDDKARRALVADLDLFVSGPMKLTVVSTGKHSNHIEADVARARVTIPWVGWTKDAGVPGRAVFDMTTEGERLTLSNFELSGASFDVAGDIVLDGGDLVTARFGKVTLNRGDNIAVNVSHDAKGYAIDVSGRTFDVRPVIKKYIGNDDAADAGGDSGKGPTVRVDAKVGTLSGFGGEKMTDVQLAFRGNENSIDSIRLSATGADGAKLTVVDTAAGGNRTVQARAGNAGAVLRFLDVYGHITGGVAALDLSGRDGAALTGRVEIAKFLVENEAKLHSLVATPPPGGDRSLNDAVKRDIDVSRAEFERAFAEIEKGEGYLKLANGVVRGPLIGSTFQGTVFDADGNINMTGTFMPAYGINRIFGEIPLIGQILGNGRDRGLIGITFRLAGKSSDPKLYVNPLSVVAPGIFRSIFEYRQK